MLEPLISIKLHPRQRVYPPGSTLQGEFQIDGVAPEALRALELSVLWHTEGKGDEDYGVHHFQRFTAEADAPLQELRTFSVVLPYTPQSYEGEILKIRWCVRVRVFLDRGKSFVEDLPFQLGRIATKRATVPPS